MRFDKRPLNIRTMKTNEWSSEQLEAQMVQGKEKKIKSLIKRKTKTGLSSKHFARAVAKASGFQQKDVIEIIKALKVVIFEQMKNGEYVKIEDVGGFYPILRRARQGTNLRGGKSADQMTVPPTWEMKFFINDIMFEFMKKLDVTEEQINNLYEN